MHKKIGERKRREKDKEREKERYGSGGDDSAKGDLYDHSGNDPCDGHEYRRNHIEQKIAWLYLANQKPEVFVSR